MRGTLDPAPLAARQLSHNRLLRRGQRSVNILYRLLQEWCTLLALCGVRCKLFCKIRSQYSSCKFRPQMFRRTLTLTRMHPDPCLTESPQEFQLKPAYLTGFQVNYFRLRWAWSAARGQ